MESYSSKHVPGVGAVFGAAVADVAHHAVYVYFVISQQEHGFASKSIAHSNNVRHPLQS